MEQLIEDVQAVDQPMCIICEQHYKVGIHICDEFICDSCEREMVRTDVSDAKYAFFITYMKRVFQVKRT